MGLFDTTGIGKGSGSTVAKGGEPAPKDGWFGCDTCSMEMRFTKGETVQPCSCGCNTWRETLFNRSVEWQREDVEEKRT